MALEPVCVALDWTPNTNHTGFYVARNKGWYRDAGLDVEFRSPHVDEYKSTPASHVTSGTALFAVTPSESVISHYTHPAGDRPKVVAVATLLQASTSAIVSLKSSGIDRPAKLDGKRYASYAARYEGRIVQQMIINDGGKGDYQELTPAMLGIWNTLLKGDADATWVFMGWEGIQAQLQGVELNVFKLEDYKVPYGYSPVLIALPQTLSERQDLVRKFISTTARGYQEAAKHPEEAAKILFDEVAADTASCPLPQPLELEMLLAAQAFTSKHYLTPAGQWGVMSVDVWKSFLDWLSNQGLLTHKIQSRAGPGPHTTTLDGLRTGDVGSIIAREQVKDHELFTNDFV